MSTIAPERDAPPRAEVGAPSIIYHTCHTCWHRWSDYEWHPFLCPGCLRKIVIIQPDWVARLGLLP